MTEVEAKYLRHCIAGLKLDGDAEEAMACARRFAELDPFQLAGLPDLLQAAIDKHSAKRAPIPATAN